MAPLVPVTPPNLQVSSPAALSALLGTLWDEGLLWPDPTWGCRMVPADIIEARVTFESGVRIHRPDSHLLVLSRRTNGGTSCILAAQDGRTWRALPSLFLCNGAGTINAQCVEEAFAKASKTRIGATAATGMPVWAYPRVPLEDRISAQAYAHLERFGAAFMWQKMGIRTGRHTLFVHEVRPNADGKAAFCAIAPGQLSCTSELSPLFRHALVQTLKDAGLAPHDLMQHPTSSQRSLQISIDIDAISAHAMIQALLAWERTQNTLMANT